jgi:type 1 glutamine amidotransferase
MTTFPNVTVQIFTRRLFLLASLPFFVAAVAVVADEARAADKKIVLVAGTPSHGAGDHEFNAGTLLLKKCLDNVPGIKCDAHLNGWPKDRHAFDGADAIMLYMDGGSGHPLIRDENLAQMRELMAKGVGLVCVHYAVEVPKDRGGPELKDWIGGYYETGYSINPHWVAEIKNLPDHPITRGVKGPFKIRDEWYFNMRFRPEMEGVIPIVSATPPDGIRGTPAAKEHPGREEVLAWAVERPDGGRGFGFTGGHFHINWGDDYFRKLILNALVWAAHGDVPADGVPSHVEAEELRQNLDPKGKKK